MNPYPKKNAINTQNNFKKHKKYVDSILNSLIRKYGYIVDKHEREDLGQIGLVNLLECLRKFDASTGTLFSTYAYPRISGGFIDEFRRNSSIPRRQQKIYTNYRELATKYARENKQLTLTIAAQKLGISTDTMSSLLLKWEAGKKVYIDDEATIISLGNDFTDDPELITISNSDVEVIQAEINKLDEREKIIIDLYFYHELNLKTIGEKLGITEGRVSQLKNQAILKIRAQIA